MRAGGVEDVGDGIIRTPFEISDACSCWYARQCFQNSIGQLSRPLIGQIYDAVSFIFPLDTIQTAGQWLFCQIHRDASFQYIIISHVDYMISIGIV